MGNYYDRENGELYCESSCAAESGARKEDVELMTDGQIARLMPAFPDADFENDFWFSDGNTVMPIHGRTCPRCGREFSHNRITRRP